MAYEWILFDADDTLFDYSAAEAFALANAFGSYGLDCGPELVRSYRSLNQQLWHEFEQGLIPLEALRIERFKRLWQQHNLAVEVTPDAFSAVYLQHLEAGDFLIPGAVEICEELLSMGCRLAIVTNGIKAVQLGRIGRSKLSQAFEHIIVSEDAGAQKPRPEIFDYTFMRLHLHDKSKALMVGDSLSSDMQGGVNYGIDTCWFNPSGKVNDTRMTPTYEISGLAELLPIVAARRKQAEENGAV